MTVYSNVETLQGLSGSNAKIAFLQSMADNTLFKNYLRAVYDPHTNYYMVAYKALPPSGTHSDEEVDKILDFVLVLSDRVITGGAALDAMKEFTGTLSSQGQLLLRMLINRDIKAGIGESSLNKAWPNFLHIEPYQRCTLEKNAKIPLAQWKKFYSQLKADGMFAAMRLGDLDSSVSGRSGLMFPMSKPFKDLIGFARVRGEEYILNGKTKLKDCTLEGELTLYRNGVLLERQVGNGMLNSLQQSGQELPSDVVIQFDVWDIVPTSLRVDGGVYPVPYSQRFDAILNLFSTHETNNFNPIKPIDTLITTSLDRVREHFHEQLAKGLEGTVVKHPDIPWADGTNKLQIKLKVEAECDLKIVGFNPGDATSKNNTTFGSLQLESADGLLEVAATGLPDELRADLWNRRDSLLANGGAIVTVKFNSIMKPKKEGGVHSLFLPRFIEERHDKKEADSLERIFEQFEAAKKNSKSDEE